MTSEQALQNLYMAARAANTTAEIHEGLRNSFELLAEVLRNLEQGIKS